MIRFVDLFAGIGGIRLGFENALDELGIPHNCVLSSEIDKRAQETYQMNFQETPKGDIFQIKEFPSFDFLLAGFPCQPFSYAGKQMGFGDTRGTLFFEIEKHIASYQPRGFLLENVRGILTHDRGRTLQTIQKKLINLGYGVKYLLLNSSDFNVPQNRSRIYILGIKNADPVLSIKSAKGAADSHQFRKNIDKSSKNLTNIKLVEDILENNAASNYDCSPYFSNELTNVLIKKKLSIHGVRMIDFRNGNSVHSWELGIKGLCTSDEINFMNLLIANRRKKIFGDTKDGKNLSIEQIKTFFNLSNIESIISSLVKKKYLRRRGDLYNPVSGNMSFEVYKFLDPKSVSVTLVSSDAHKLGVFHQGRIRRITPRECARLQGYPDNFKCHPNDHHAYKQLGNSVSVPVVHAVIRDLFKNNMRYLAGDSTDRINSSWHLEAGQRLSA